jgi:ubiquinone/menaquinone biosynthesis C-methylase UbiE
MNFPPPDEFVKIMADAGLARVQKFPLTFGITWLYVGIKGKAGRL